MRDKHQAFHCYEEKLTEGDNVPCSRVFPARESAAITYNTNRLCLVVSRELYDLLARCIQFLCSLLARTLQSPREK